MFRVFRGRLRKARPGCVLRDCACLARTQPVVLEYVRGVIKSLVDICISTYHTRGSSSREWAAPKSSAGTHITQTGSP